MRCTDGITMTEAEFLAIVALLGTLPPTRARRVLDQSKERPWFEDTTYRACLFIDVDTDLCLIYPARPLICRLFGRVPHLPCPSERAPADGDARRLADDPDAPRRTFTEWMTRHGVYDVCDLLADDPPERYAL